MVVKGELVGLTLGPERLRAIAAMRERPELCSCNERAHQSVFERKAGSQGRAARWRRPPYGLTIADMDTDELIKALVSNLQPVTPLSAVWRRAAALAIVATAAIFFGTLGLRSDIAAAAETLRFLFKLAVAVALTASAFGLVRVISRPGEPWWKAAFYLAVSPALLAVAVVVEISVLPPEMWSASMIGMNSLICVISILLLGIVPLAIFLVALRHGASTRPAAAGAAAGLLAGGIAATFFALQCTNDSPLFVATWYTLAIAGLAAIGAACAKAMVWW